jgi:flagellar basal body-associated protein FliL
MSDEQQDLNLEDVGASTEDAGAPKRGGIFSGLILTILKWAAIGIGFIILGVTTTVITVSLVNKGNAPKGAFAESPEYQSKAPPLLWSDQIPNVRGQTADETPGIFLVRISLGYDGADKEISVEIGARAPEIQDLLLKYLAQKTAADLSARNYEDMQAELRDRINAMMRNGKIKKVVFREFSVIR